MTKTVYQTLATTGEYRGAIVLDDSDLSPLEEGVYLIPGGCVEIEPPAVPEGSVAAYRNGAWSVIEDHRGDTVYLDGVATVIAELGPLPDGATTEPPPPTEDDLWAALRARRDALLAACDWTQTLDSPLSETDRTAWATYRQALRDLPANMTDPASPIWPEAPQ